MRRTPIQNDLIQDDATNIAGWVFADLLLSLSVIFLTSISFALPSTIIGSTSTANNSGVEVGNLGQSSNQVTASSQGYNFYYTGFDKEAIEKDLFDYFIANAMSPKSEVLYAQIVGGFDPKIEGSEMGTIRALEFSIALKKGSVSAFDGANFDLSTSREIKPDAIALRLSFAPPIAQP